MQDEEQDTPQIDQPSQSRRTFLSRLALGAGAVAVGGAVRTAAAPPVEAAPVKSSSRTGVRHFGMGRFLGVRAGKQRGLEPQWSAWPQPS